MKRYNKLLRLKELLFGFSALLLLASCGSYQYAGYDNDGIYSSDQDEAYTANEYEESYENTLYYKQLFAEKSEQFANVPEEGAIFTDIDGYSSGAYGEEYAQEDQSYAVGRPAWGSDPDEISINIYQDPFYNPFYHPFINPYYVGSYHPLWYPYGHYPYSFGYHSPWSIGIGFNYGWNSWRYGYNPYYSHYGGYYSPYYYGGHNYYNRENVAYGTTRRNSYVDYRGYGRSNLEARSSRIQDYSNPREVRAVRSNSDERTYSTRSTRVRSTGTTTRRSTISRGNRSSENSVRSIRKTRSRSNNATRVRSTRPSRSSANVRSSSSTTRSSGTVRSSSSRSSRGRGNQ